MFHLWMNTGSTFPLYQEAMQPSIVTAKGRLWGPTDRHLSHRLPNCVLLNTDCASISSSIKWTRSILNWCAWVWLYRWSPGVHSVWSGPIPFWLFNIGLAGLLWALCEITYRKCWAQKKHSRNVISSIHSSFLTIKREARFFLSSPF